MCKIDSQIHYQRENCRLCLSRNMEKAVEYVPTPPGDIYPSKDEVGKEQKTYPLDLYLCNDCGSIQLRDVINPKILYGKYIYQTAVSLGLSNHFKQAAQGIIDYVKPDKDDLVVDIGSNDGTFLKAFKDKGFKVLGIDPAHLAVKSANSAGIPTIEAFFNLETAKKIVRDYGKAKIITANNVFANIDDLSAFMANIKELMLAEGFFIFETGYVLDLVKNKLIDVIYHEHLSYFAVKPLDTFFKRLGLQLAHAEHIGTKGGSIRCFVQFPSGKKSVNDSINTIRALEEEEKIFDAKTYDQFSSFIKNTRVRLVNLLKSLKEQNKTIAGFGASVGVTTLLYLFGLDQYLDYLLDDNPVRFGLFSPGQHIPVYSSKILYERKPDYVLILAWRYEEVIRNKHKQYEDNGGSWISLFNPKS